MVDSLHFTISYSGERSDHNEIDFYDVSEALRGFQRSLALTTHLVLNNQVITQAPSLRGATILALPPTQGSWKFTANVVLLSSGLYALTTAPLETPLGHLVSSAYDYVISETMGFHVDYSKTLLKQYEELKGATPDVAPIPQNRFDSLMEKCIPAIEAMHRPIVESETASQAEITAQIGKRSKVFPNQLTRDTYDYIHVTKRSDKPFKLRGRVASYNVNTFKGRIFVLEEGRPIPFELGPDARTPGAIETVTRSLAINARGRSLAGADMLFFAFKIMSRSGKTKGYLVTEITGLEG